MNAFDTFTLTPLSAGDIIDRAVRIYKRNFPALLRIVLGPSLIAYTGGIMYYIGFRNFSFTRGETRVILTTSLIVVGGILWLTGKIAFYAMLGGASKSLVYLFFDGTPLRARDVYRSVRRKFGTLVTAAILIAAISMGVGFLIYMGVLVMILVLLAIAGLLADDLPRWLMLTINIAFGTLIVVGTITVLLAVYSRIVYVPQVLMVEDKSASSAIGRSISLAGGEIRRIGVLILFWFYIAWSFWLLLMLPVGAYGYWAGYDLNPFNLDIPIWFNVVQQTITQISEIIIAPIAMLGFTLLYLDSRVRKEGFDVELMANRVLAPPTIMPPPNPAAVSRPVEPLSPGSIFGLSEPAVVREVPVEPPVEAPVEAPIEAPAPQAEPTAVIEMEREPLREPALETARKPVPVEIQQRVCRWCETGADPDDRFCRVCGAVF